ncbi:MAG: Histidyl-tRNA synthetase [Candidatus Woesebacteria bacterium GW2011_GWA1_39_8]|jgi:histidyl-tRNA synthetase|uniref:Histidine--tRNA ligase n=1 Tax=Candidatus Woesebacteria bacterium GW2011_GWA1_39_8 TaxID=1618552 RepID=A0A0G0SXC1_9BACT|nr:MAG: Histidyl-tRNA synthetase [Candidatus Woesebacteria bacterium GW2011_GWA1_39_8]
MDKTYLQPLKGFRDFLPAEANNRQYLIDRLRRTFSLFGFEPLETPALEYEELLLGKYGDQADKLVYKFEDLGGRKVALRYDQTVPTSRILAMYNQKLPMPWRRFQIQPVWRAENTQAGRYREFLQCDADIYGSSSVVADTEILTLADTIYQDLGFKDFTIYVNDRKILFELLHFANIPENLHLAVIAEIDKLDRNSEAQVAESLKAVGLTDENVKHLFHHLNEQQPTPQLKEIIDNAIALGVSENRLQFQARLARGLDYYTGMIFEIKIKGYDKGSVLGGGRYDNLIEKLSGTDIPAVGFAVGFDRTLEAIDELKLLPTQQNRRKGVLVGIFNKELRNNSFVVASYLRTNNIQTEVYPDDSAKLAKQLKYADRKGIKWLIVVGPDEVKNNRVILKNLEDGHQEDVKLESLPKKINADK